MNDKETIVIPKGAMINNANHEDDDPLIAEKPLTAIPQGPLKDGGIEVIIPEIDPNRTFYIHQPEKGPSE